LRSFVAIHFRFGLAAPGLCVKTLLLTQCAGFGGGKEEAAKIFGIVSCSPIKQWYSGLVEALRRSFFEMAQRGEWLAGTIKSVHPESGFRPCPDCAKMSQ